jgi:hypothetical protein
MDNKNEKDGESPEGEEEEITIPKSIAKNSKKEKKTASKF